MGYDYKRGEIYYVANCETYGNEQFSGRPGIIVSVDGTGERYGVVEVVYLTTKPKMKLSTHVPINSSKYPSTALCEQITTVSINRLGDRFGQCTDEEMRQVDAALAESVGIRQIMDNGHHGDSLYEEYIAVKAERDTYRRLYEDLTKRLIPPAAGA